MGLNGRRMEEQEANNEGLCVNVPSGYIFLTWEQYREYLLRTPKPQTFAHNFNYKLWDWKIEKCACLVCLYRDGLLNDEDIKIIGKKINPQMNLTNYINSNGN